MNKIMDFGAPSGFGIHHFYVEIPVGVRDAISIYEDFGFDGDEGHREIVECRIILARDLWTIIRDDARRDFNNRLKIKKQSTGNWAIGKVKLDRFLGRELCVLCWAAEYASVEECSIISQKWAALRPEERWWLYSKTASEAGQSKDTQRGWRKALYCALCDGKSIKLEPKTKPKMKQNVENQQYASALFDFMEKGDI